MKKVFCSFGFMVVLGSLFFASCSKEKDAAVQPAAPQISQGAARTLETPALPEGPVTLNLMGGAHLVSTTEAALKGYLKENPNVTINFEKYSYAEYPVKMRLQFASGDSSPDVALIHDIFIPQFIDAEWLMDLSGMIPYDQVLPFLGNASRGDKT
jgi:ABC-type glycerol-3-phosphate transport system substrate-binding protein